MTTYEETEREAGNVLLAPGQRSRRSTRRRGQKAEWSFGRWLVYLILVFGAIVFMAPFAWLVSASFQNLGEIFSGHAPLDPPQRHGHRLPAVPQPRSPHHRPARPGHR